MSGLGTGADSGPPPGVPRWVKLSALAIVIALVALWLVSTLLGMQHGPGMGPGH